MFYYIILIILVKSKVKKKYEKLTLRITRAMKNIWKHTNAASAVLSFILMR